MKRGKQSRTRRSFPKRSLSLPSKESQRGYQHAIDEFIAWYCSEPKRPAESPAGSSIRLTNKFIGTESQIPIVDQQESDRGVGAGPLVAIDARVILAEMEEVGRSHGRDRRM